MEFLNWYLVYIYMWLVCATAVIEEGSAKDVMVSFIVGATWPIFIPSRIIRKLITTK